MKTQIKASQIRIGDNVEIFGRAGFVTNKLGLEHRNSFIFDLGAGGKVQADDCDTKVFIITEDDEDEAREVMNRLASEFATYVDILRERFDQSLAKFHHNTKTSLASAIIWKAEQALIDEFIYKEISELATKLVDLESPQAARYAVLRVVDYERDSFLNHYRAPNSSNWASNGVKNVENAARQQMLRNDGEAYKPILAIIDDFITKEIA